MFEINEKRNLLLYSLLLCVSCLAVYGQTFDFSFLLSWDDEYYLQLNKTIRSFTVEHVKKALTTFHIGNYAPVHILSYMLDYSLWGFNAGYYHAENVLLHILNGLLFFLVLRRLGLPDIVSFIAAFIFLLHPSQVESVAWISQRKNLLAMLFFLGALYSYMRFRTSDSGSGLFYIVSVLFLVISLLSKSVAVIFPAVALCYDFSFQKQGSRLHVLDKIPFFLAAAGFAVVTVLSQSQMGAIRSYPGGNPLSAVATMIPVLFSYIRDCFWPFSFSPYYMIEPKTSLDSMFIVSLCGFFGLVAVAVLLARKYRNLFFFYTVFFLSLVPVIQIVPIVTLKNDRYLYFPMLGFSGLVAVILWNMWRSRFRTMRIFVVMLTTVIGLALPVVTYNLTGNWKDDLALWSYAITKDPENRMAWIMICRTYTRLGDTNGALRASNTYQFLRDKYGPVRGFERD